MTKRGLDLTTATPDLISALHTNPMGYHGHDHSIRSATPDRDFATAKAQADRMFRSTRNHVFVYRYPSGMYVTVSTKPANPKVDLVYSTHCLV